jgi:hypothetical protein
LPARIRRASMVLGGLPKWTKPGTPAALVPCCLHESGALAN